MHRASKSITITETWVNIKLLQFSQHIYLIKTEQALLKIWIYFLQPTDPRTNLKIEVCLSQKNISLNQKRQDLA